MGAAGTAPPAPYKPARSSAYAEAIEATPRPARTDGERWARAELEALLAARFSLPAVERFLEASFARSRATRQARPSLARQARRWEAIGAVAWVGLAGGGSGRFRASLRPGLLGWSATCLMLDWHLGMVETESGREQHLGPADALTLGRAWLAPAVAREPSTVLLVVGFLTDALDGQFARARAPSRLGRDLEGLADAYFGVAATAGVLRSGRLPRPVAALELARLAAGLVGTVTVWFGSAAPPSDATLRAARALAPVRAAGIVAASAGRRGLGTVLSTTGAMASMGLAARAIRRPQASPRAGGGLPT